MRSARIALALGLALTGVAGFVSPSGGADDAGVYDFLLGHSAPTRPLPLTVAPSRTRHVRPAAPRRVEEPRRQLAAKFEWRGDPDWFLRDGSLRSGDIIVLKDRFVRFTGTGRPPFNQGDFATLSSDEVNRLRIGDIAAL